MGCGQQPVTDLAIEVAAALSGSQQQVVVVCPATDASISGNQAGLEKELDQLLSIQEAIDADDIKHMFIYISQGKSDASSAQRRKVLQAASPPPPAARVVPEPLKGFRSYTTCGQLCQVRCHCCVVSH